MVTLPEGRVDLIYTENAPQELRPYMQQYEAIILANEERARLKPFITIGAFGAAFLFGVSLMSSALGDTIIAPLSLAATIGGGLWLHFNKQNELQALRKYLDLEYFFKAKGFTILYIPVAGTCIFPNP